MLLNKEKIKYLITLLKKQENLEENILNKLFDMHLNLINESANKNKEYFNKMKQASILYEKIEKNVNSEEIVNLIDDWMCLENESFFISNEIYYKTGVKDGINIILIALEDFLEEEV